METNYNYAAAPASFAKCLVTDCTAANRCLRHLAAQAVPADTEQMLAVNPKRTCPAAGESCPCFRTSTAARRPRGFIRTLNALPRSEAAGVAADLIQALNRRLYYRLRKGEFALNAAHKALVENILIRHGAPQPVEFDAYEEELDW